MHLMWSFVKHRHTAGAAGGSGQHRNWEPQSEGRKQQTSSGVYTQPKKWQKIYSTKSKKESRKCAA